MWYPLGRNCQDPDGHEWGFWSEHRYDGYRPVGGQSEMYCLFPWKKSANSRAKERWGRDGTEKVAALALPAPASC